jgi:hypothetical protein
VLVLPLLLFYEISVLFTDMMNGADLLTRTLVEHFGLRGFIWFQGGLALFFVVLVLYLRRTQHFDFKRFLPVVLESGIYALTMGTLIIFVMVELLKIDPRLSASSAVANAGLFDRLVLSVGAGVHEELLFRLGLMTAFSVLFQRVLGLRRWSAILGAMVLSSVLFSAAHHLGPLGDPLRLGVFVYRLIAGMVFAVLFQFRGFAIAVYTHALYDIYVMVLG